MQGRRNSIDLVLQILWSIERMATLAYKQANRCIGEYKHHYDDFIMGAIASQISNAENFSI